MARYYVQTDDKEMGLEVLHKEGSTTIQALDLDVDIKSPEVPVDFATVHSSVGTEEDIYSLIVNGKSYQVHVERTEEGLRMIIGRHRFDAQVLTEREWRLKKVAPRQAQHSGVTTIKAPMPGLVKAVAVDVGDAVQKGQRLVVLEAMKMENDINAPRDGRVTGVHVAQGTTVEGGKPLVTIE